MKKVLLTSLILGASVAGFSQGIKAAQPGYAFEDFNSATEYSNDKGTDPIDYDLGIYLWKDTLNTAIPYYKLVAGAQTALTDGVLKSEKVRVGDGKVSYTVSQAYGLFAPQLGVSFGAGKSIDLTGTSSLKLKVGLKIDATTLANTKGGVKIKFSLKDANGTGLDSKGAKGGATDQWKDEIYAKVNKTTGVFTASADLAAGTITFAPSPQDATVTDVTIDFNTSGTNVGYEAIYPKLTDVDYVDNQNCVSDLVGDGGKKGASNPKTGFDATKVAGFQITFLDASQAAGDCYFNEALTDLKFDFTGFILGDMTVGVADEEVFNKKGFIAYPSPIKGGNVKLSATAENVKVYDVIGNVVFSANSASEINVDGFNKGLYIVKSSKGSTRFVVE